MRVDPVQAIAQDAQSTTAQDYNGLASSANELQEDSVNPPVPATAETEAQTASRDVTQGDTTQVGWNEDPPRVVYKVVSSDGNVVYQIPSAEVLDLAKDINASLEKEANRESTVDVRS